jgi:hypothetical protein
MVKAMMGEASMAKFEKVVCTKNSPIVCCVNGVLMVKLNVSTVKIRDDWPSRPVRDLRTPQYIYSFLPHTSTCKKLVKPFSQARR